MIGPAVAGLVIASVGTGWAFVINGASYAAVLASLCLFRVAELRTRWPGRCAPPAASLLGLRYVWGRPDLKRDPAGCCS